MDVLTATKNKNTNKTKVEILLDENFQNYGIRVVDTDADSYCCHRPVAAVIKSAEEEKKRKAVEARRGSFSPFVVSVDGFVGVEASCVLRRVAEVLSWKWGKSYGKVMDWVRWAVWRGFEDGVGLPVCGTD